MTTDIARIDQNATLALSNGNDALQRLGQWVTAAQHAHQLVSPLVETPFVPDAYRPKVDPRATDEEKTAARSLAVANATAAVLQGITLGLDPLTALQQIYIVHGRPGMYTEAMVALVKAAGHEIWTEDLSDSRAVVCGRRSGETHVERVTVTMQQAKTAGWTRNDNYTKTPQDMLYARAAGRACKRTAPEVLLGIVSVEEIRDTIQVEAEVGPATRTVKPRRQVKAALAPAPEAEDPPLEDEPATTAAPAPEPEPGEATVEPAITQAQSRKLHAALRDTGRTDRDEALVWIAGIVGRAIDSTKELTKREAEQVIDTLEAATAAEPPLDVEWPDTSQPADADTGQA